MPSRPAPRAAALADDLLDGLARGLWSRGARLPSVRALARERGVSVATVLGAYARLEDRGIIERRPRSGLFVRALPRPPEPPPAPRPAAAVGDPGAEDLDLLAQTLLTPVRRAGDLALLGTVPVGLLPRGVLARLTRAALAGEAWLAYADPAGEPRLRAAIARRLLAGGTDLHPDELVITGGAMEALALALRAACAPGDIVAVESPGFFGILQLAADLRLRVVEVPSDPVTGLRVDALAAALDAHPVRAVVAVPSFANPGGGCMPDAERRRLVELLARRGVPLIEDDIYGDLAHRGPRPVPCRAHDRHGGVMLVGSFSKCLGPGLRVGWIAAGRHHAAVRRLKRTATVASPTLPQLVLADYLDGGGFERHLVRLRAVLAERTAALADAVVAAFPAGTLTTRPAGGFGLWIELPTPARGLDLYRAAAGHGLHLAPGDLFSVHGSYTGFIRLGAAAYTRDQEPRIRHLGRLVAHLLRR